MLHRRVGEVFLEAEACAAFSDSLRRFLVPDRGTERDVLSVVLLVESPHTTEVLPRAIDDRYPLAGSDGNHAGRRVNDKFMDCELDLPEGQSIGRLVHQGCDTVRGLGIMNASQLPFQEGAYINQDGEDQGDEIRRNTRIWNKYIKSIQYIRKIYQKERLGWKTYKHVEELRSTIDCLECAIVMDLRERLRHLHRRNPDVLLVRCGYVARNFYTEARIDIERTCDLPHPSHLSWNTLNCQNPCLHEIVTRLLAAQNEA